MIDEIILHKRKSIRLSEYDYSLEGSYFVTVCIKGRINLLGEITNGTMKENECGNIIRTCWNELSLHYDNIILDEFVVMPNHVHGIICIVGVIHESPLQTKRSLPQQPIHESPRRMNKLERRQMLLPKIIGRFKMNSSKQINITRGTTNIQVWQKNYYEHIIRNEKALNKIRNYIFNNPAQWECDKENPAFKGVDEFDGWLTEQGKTKI